ncbi:hypothetical protein GIX45_11250 [Erwinia sp. CPCC 100877]|nr:hypothetical protein [Erwinia sp. CPCC 100877]
MTRFFYRTFHNQPKHLLKNCYVSNNKKLMDEFDRCSSVTPTEMTPLQRDLARIAHEKTEKGKDMQE